MEALDQARVTIYTELTSDDSEVRASYLAEFGSDVNAFADAMAQAVLVWQKINGALNGDEEKGYVAALAYAVLTLHVTSMKLFLSGHIVAAGNLMRQVVESIAMAILCSAKNLDVRQKFMKDQYSTNDAVRDVLRHAKKKNIKLKEGGLGALKSSQDCYHTYSHISRLTLASLISFSQEGIYVGASFDKAKVDSYRKEVAGRVSLAKIFPNILEGVRSQLADW